MLIADSGQIGTVGVIFSKILNNSVKPRFCPPNPYSHNSVESATAIRPVTVQGDLAHQALEAVSSFRSAATFAQVVVDDHNSFARPTEGNGTVGKRVLSSS